MASVTPPLDVHLTLTPERAERAMYLIQDGWFITPRMPHRTGPRRCGTLADFVSYYAPPDARPEVLLPPPLREAFSYIDQAPTLSFVLGELIPYLRTLARPQSSSIAAVPEPQMKRIQDLVARGARLRRRLPSGLDRDEFAERLAGWLETPCAIQGDIVVPLQRVAHAPRGRDSSFVVVGGQAYLYRLSRARKLDEFRRAFVQAGIARSKKELMRDKSLRVEAAEFVADVRSLLGEYGSEPRARCVRVYGDRHHEVQNSRGSWMLVRGPVRRRTRGDRFYLGVALRGPTRRQLLSNMPLLVPSPDAFWTSAGDPRRGGICMGRLSQFRRLGSRDFTTAEAVVHWLDAAVIIATGRSALHRALLESREHPQKAARPQRSFIRDAVFLWDTPQRRHIG